MYQKKFQVLILEKTHRLQQKKISEKYKKIRDAKKYKIPGEIVKVEEVETPEGKIKVPISIEKSKKAAKKIKNMIKLEEKKCLKRLQIQWKRKEKQKKLTLQMN